MSKIKKVSIFMLLFVAFTSFYSFSQEKLALLKFYPGNDSKAKWVSNKMYDILKERFGKDLLIPEKDLLKVLKDNGLNIDSGLLPNEAKEFSKDLNARFWIRGEVSPKGDDFSLKVFVIDVTIEDEYDLPEYIVKRDEKMLRSYADSIANEIGSIKQSGYQKFIQISKTFIAKNDHNQAIKYLEKASKANKTDPEIPYLIGFIYFDEKNYTKAAPYFETALKLNPKDEKILSKLALTYINIGKKEDAVKLFKSIVDENPNDHSRWYTYGSSLLIIGMHEKAIEALEKSLSLKDEVNTHLALANIYNVLADSFARDGSNMAKSKEYSKKYALEFEKIAKTDEYKSWDNTKKIDFLKNVADTYIRIESYDDAARLYTEIINLDGNKTSALYLKRGAIYESAKKYDLAKADYEKYSKLEPTKADAYTYLANLYINAYNKNEEAFKYASKALEIEPNNGLANFVIGNYWYDKAEVIYKKAAQFGKAGKQKEYVNTRLEAYPIFKKAESYYQKVVNCSQESAAKIKLQNIEIMTKFKDDEIFFMTPQQKAMIGK